MAAVTVKEGAQFDGSKIYNHVVSYLPAYARPRFIRIKVRFIHCHWQVSTVLPGGAKTCFILKTLPVLMLK